MVSEPRSLFWQNPFLNIWSWYSQFWLSDCPVDGHNDFHGEYSIKSKIGKKNFLPNFSNRQYRYTPPRTTLHKNSKFCEEDTNHILSDKSTRYISNLTNRYVSIRLRWGVKLEKMVHSFKGKIFEMANNNSHNMGNQCQIFFKLSPPQ